jgi:hypothetical protein
VAQRDANAPKHRVQGSQKNKMKEETTIITFNKFTILGLWKALATLSCKIS